MGKPYEYGESQILKFAVGKGCCNKPQRASGDKHVY